MDYSKYAGMISKYMEEAAKVKESYSTAKEGIIEEYEARKKTFRDVEERLSRIQEAFKKGEVTKGIYNRTKKDYERAEQAYKELGEKLNEIDQFMYARLNSVVRKLEDMKRKYNEEVNKETMKLKYQLKKAKYDFLTSLAQVRDEYNKTVDQVRGAYNKLSEGELELQMINKDLAPQSVISEQDADQFLSPVVLDEKGAAEMKEELSSALHAGKIPQDLEVEITDAKNQGIIS